MTNRSTAGNISILARNSAESSADNDMMDTLSLLLPWHAHATAVLLVHVVWCTRARAPCLEPRFDAWLAALLERKARAIDCQLLAAGVATDHVHVLVRHPPRVSLSKVVHRLKGAASHALHRESPATTGHVWQVGYWAESVSPHDLNGLCRYIRHQRAHHAAADPSAEPWQAFEREARPKGGLLHARTDR